VSGALQNRAPLTAHYSLIIMGATYGPVGVVSRCGHFFFDLCGVLGYCLSFG
jgi:hypothetical protein